MNRRNWLLIMAGLCIGGISCGSWADMDTPVPIKKHHKKHHKTVKPATEAPKVMSLSNDDLPKRHNYYAPQDQGTSPTAASNNVPVTTRPLQQSAPSAAAAAPGDPYAALN